MAEDLPFDLSLTEEQAMTRDSLRRFAERQVRPVARPADEAGAAPAGFYDSTVELGLTLLPIPELHGGAGMPRDPISNVLAVEDLAWGDLTLTLGSLAPLGVINALLDFASEAQQETFLPRLATEQFVPAAVALMEGRATFEPGELATSAVIDGDDYCISGEKRMVPFADNAELLLVVANEPGQGPVALLVERAQLDSAAVSIERVEYMGLRALPLYSVRFDQLRVPASHRLAAFDLQRLVDLSRIGTAALSLGCCQALLDFSIPYVNERKAFGEPVAWRQSVAFMVANIGIELEAMRLLVWRAASRASQGLPFHREAYLARVLCADKAMEIGTNGIQLFGGAGFIRDYPLEMWYRNLRAIGILEGALMV